MANSKLQRRGSGAFVAVAMLALLPVPSAVAITAHPVGGYFGIWESGHDYQSWADAQEFVVGDFIDFTYEGGHNVLQLQNKIDMDHCDKNALLINMWTSGNDHVELQQEGFAYFMSGFSNDCILMMQFSIYVRLGP